ncbi:phosphate ABC transporter substrate-binding/OmpA family protein [Mameliella sediminis]|uniref:phosphate ABC transporter substrate-binding/OmpA family protein n=1 Tax=Mameliella sediminis TaxID=2836866 RepID=UPI001C4803E1|nr:phosphate ABC transporter substrate-binding/OmpA family protein [Mameliella sediminis]MBV7395077.1 substrate-binding domain-containing protein [Mameliella sediminis]
MSINRAAVFAALFFVLQAGIALAQDITLKSRDGSISLRGTLLGFDGEFYRIETRFGELTVDGSGVTCTGIGCPSLTDYVADVTFSGSATLGRALLPALIEDFARRNGLDARRTEGEALVYALHEGTAGRLLGRFTLRNTDTDRGFADLLADEADLAMALREIRPEEAVLAREAGLGDLTQANRSRVLALDAMVPIVAPGNPLDRLSIAQVVDILAGEIRNWSELGGPDAPITVHLRDNRAGMVQGLQDRLLRPQRRVLAETTRPYGDNRSLVRAVMADPFGIGLTSLTETGQAKTLVLTGSCGFTLRAGRSSIKTEDYPLTAPMFLYSPARRLPKLARDFLAYSHGPAAQAAIRRAGFVDQAPEEIALDRQGDRLANAIAVAEGEEGLVVLQEMVADLAPMRRLSTTFRFETGSSKLDAQSRSNVLALAHALETGVHDGRELVFVGFSDGVGPASANLDIARRRAEAVRDAVVTAAETADLDRVTIGTQAYGEALPMACDDSAWGRQVNRRVEVWLR